MGNDETSNFVIHHTVKPMKQSGVSTEHDYKKTIISLLSEDKNAKHATKTITTQDINSKLVGYEYISPDIHITQNLVDNFISLVGDNNPHYNTEDAKHTKLGKTPVPGGLIQALIANQKVIHDALNVTGANHLVLENNLSFKKPILIGDAITYKLQVLSAYRGIVKRNVSVLVGEEIKCFGNFTSYYQKRLDSM